MPVKVACRLNCMGDKYCGRRPLLMSGSIIPLGCTFPYTFIIDWHDNGLDYVIDLSSTSLIGLRTWIEGKAR